MDSSAPSDSTRYDSVRYDFAHYDFAVIGGGIVGLATARELARQGSVVVLEKEPHLAGHQTGHNSGVIHSGLYYRPGSLKATLCTAGRERLEAFCQEHDVPFHRSGKLVVAAEPGELPALDELERRGRANGLEGLERLDAAGLRDREPGVRGLEGLWVPQTGLVDYGAVCQALARDLEASGATVRTRFEVEGLRRTEEGWHLQNTREEVLSCDRLVACGGLHADRLARKAGLRPGIAIVPFRGEYYQVRRPHLVQVPVYPVPDPRFPFLGVHLTPTVDGRLEAGPNAVLALAREGYRRRDISPKDVAEMLTFPGFPRLLTKVGRAGLSELWRSLSRRRFAHALARLVPDVNAQDLEPAPAGVRAQAVDRQGRLLDDFHLLEAPNALFVLNAPSPAATASLAIAEHLADRALNPSTS